MQIVVLAGGLGTRLYPLTRSLPKALAPVADRPFLEYQLDLFRRQGFAEVILLTGHRGEQIRAHVERLGQPGLSVRICDEGETPLGTAGAVRHAARWLADPFFLTYGDSSLRFDYAAALAHLQQRPALGLMAVYHNQDRLEPSNVRVQEGVVVAYDKERRQLGLDSINFGVSLLRRQAVDLIPATGACSQETWYAALIARGELLAFETRQRFYEIGSHRGLAEFEQLVAAGCIPAPLIPAANEAPR